MTEKIHLAIIPDGNRRYAKGQGIFRNDGHKKGGEVFKEVINWANSKEVVSEITIYVFSNENFNRPKDEVDFLMNTFVKEFTKLADSKELKKEDVKINFIGRFELLNQEVRECLYKVMDVTKDRQGLIVNIAIAYGGRPEIVDMTKKIADLVKSGDLNITDINEEAVEEHLYLKSQPNLIIRTGGENRLSNFLLWQSSYAELFFLDKMWPEFTEEDFDNIISKYLSIDRRFGK